MSTTPTKPTIVIVPGSFCVYGAYDPFVALIRAQEFPALALQLPSTQKRMPRKPATLQEDASHVRAVVEKLIEEGEGTEVVVVAHSYGGTVATEALAGLESKDGKGVKRIVYLTAMAPRVGETQLTAMGMDTGSPYEAIGGYLHIDPVLMAPAVCNDLPYIQAYEHALQLPHHSAISFQNEVTQASYKDIPVTYIFCERDLIVSPELQQKYIDTIEEVSGRKVDVKRIDSGHCPNWSKPEELLGLITEAAAL